MWKIFSLRYLLANKVSSIFIMTVALIASALLSLANGVFYNLWADLVYRTFLKTGSHRVITTPAAFAYIFVSILMCGSLILMIYHAFEVSMNSRIHQMGILQSVGATPKQIQSVLVTEVIALCLLPVITGILAGYGLSALFMELMIHVTESVRVHEVTFRYSVWVTVVSLFLSLLVMFISAWIPAHRMSKLSPLESIHQTDEEPVVRMKRFVILPKLFGAEGTLAGKSLYARRKALRTSSISLTLAFLGLVSFLSLESISGISTRQTYFERYREVWDLQLALEADLNQTEELLSQLGKISGISDTIAYQKYTAYMNPESSILSDEVSRLGGLEVLTGNQAQEVPVIVMDEESFHTYAPDSSVGHIILVNKIWNSLSSSRLHKQYIPYVKESSGLSVNLFPSLNQANQSRGLTVSVTKFSDTEPALKEGYPHGAFVLVLSQNTFETLIQQFQDQNFSKQDTIFKIQTDSDDQTALIQSQIEELAGSTFAYSSENRITKEAADLEMRKGLVFVISMLSILLASIGLANVVSNILGQIHLRRREFARYMSVGLTPKGLTKILFIEAGIILLKPLAFSLLLNIPVVVFALWSSQISVFEFIAHMPVLPVFLLFSLNVAFVGLSYYLGGKRICRGNLMDTLRDDSL